LIPILIIINQKMYVHKAGIYRADIMLVDGETGDVLKEFQQFYERKWLKNAMRLSVRDAIEEAKKLGGTEFAYDTNIGDYAGFAAYTNGVRLIDDDGALYNPELAESEIEEINAIDDEGNDESKEEISA
jgi:hypothetical protein